MAMKIKTTDLEETKWRFLIGGEFIFAGVAISLLSPIKPFDPIGTGSFIVGLSLRVLTVIELRWALSRLEDRGIEP